MNLSVFLLWRMSLSSVGLLCEQTLPCNVQERWVISGQTVCDAVLQTTSVYWYSKHRTIQVNKQLLHKTLPLDTNISGTLTWTFNSLNNPNLFYS